ncbi:helix-turn-helix domain-containing protein [Shewanella benthica]|uniref:helix-turn-helix domain-containing protein n=1 Tax=Shewanella benthica TaxID=43661 RepID=UPI001E4B1C39|nr:helix-turn-helix domain-containing protein [Shewanella benthica]
MNKQYHQLTQELRYQISASRKTGMTLRQIAEEVGVHFSTVCRELKRNITSLNYDPKMAHTLSCKRKRMSKKPVNASQVLTRSFENAWCLTGLLGRSVTACQ